MQPLIPYFDPISISLGPLTVHGFGLLVALGFWTGSSLAMKKAPSLGADPDAINRLIGWLIAGTFIGGHLGDVLFYRREMIAQDPMILLRFWEGLSSFGGFSVCVPLVIWFFWRERKSFWPHGDALSIGFTLGWFFGRMGCFSAHDHPGAHTSFYLGVYGTCPDTPALNVACHDMGLYEALFSLAQFGLFMLLARKPRFPGFYVGLLAAMYGPFRFMSDFLRSSSVDLNAKIAGLTPAQYGALVVTGLGVWILARQRNKAPLGVTG